MSVYANIVWPSQQAAGEALRKRIQPNLIAVLAAQLVAVLEDMECAA